VLFSASMEKHCTAKRILAPSGIVGQYLPSDAVPIYWTSFCKVVGQPWEENWLPGFFPQHPDQGTCSESHVEYLLCAMPTKVQP